MSTYEGTRGRVRPTMALLAAGAAGLVAAGICSAGPAGADTVTQDDAFFATVQAIYPGQNLDRAEVINNAHVTCNNLANGSTVSAEVADLMKANPSDTLAQAQAETAAAIAVFCPQYR